MTLHRAVEISRKFLIIFGAIFFGLIFILMLVTVGSSIKQSLFPTPPPPPDLRFGKIDSDLFPQSPVTKNSLTYSLNTVSGELPAFPDRIFVYKVLQPIPNLLGLDNISTLTKKNNFNGNPVPLSETQFQWTNTTPSENLLFDIVSGNFSFSKNYLNDPNVLEAKNLSDEQTAQDIAKNFFSNFDSYPTDIDESKNQTSLYKIQNGTLIPATSLSTANIIRVDFYQKDINKIPIYSESYPKSLMFALIGSTDRASEVVTANYSHKTVLTDFEATYPLITADDAYQKLKAGNAYIANYDGSSSFVVIRSVTLGYYLGSKTQLYTLPVIVFAGDNNFFAFVPAIKE